jgi:hypothetical protein
MKCANIVCDRCCALNLSLLIVMQGDRPEHMKNLAVAMHHTVLDGHCTFVSLHPIDECLLRVFEIVWVHEFE